MFIQINNNSNFTAENDIDCFRVHFLLIFVMSNVSGRNIDWNSRTSEICHIWQFSSIYKGSNVAVVPRMSDIQEHICERQAVSMH